MDSTDEREENMKLKNLLCIIAAAVLVGCAPVHPTSQQQKGSQNSILKIGDPQFTAGIDPAKDWEGWFTIRFGIGETLFRLTNDFHVEPWLASSYKKIDDQTWEIHLKENVKFSNGNPVNSDAVIASLKRVGENHKEGEIFKTATYTANNSQTFTVHTEKPSPQFIHELVDSKTAIVDVTSKDKIVGTGPYEVKEFKPNDSISLTASTHYWGGNASIKEVHYQLIPDQKTLELAIKSKEVDGGVDLNEKWKRAISKFVSNIDKDDPEYITLQEAFMEKFKEKGFVIDTMEEFERKSKEIEEVIKKLNELNRKNRALLNKYKGDKKFVRVHKRIREENNRIEKESKKRPIIISTYDDEIFKFLKSLKEKIDTKIYDRASILKNDAYFGKAVMADLMNNFREHEGNTFETADPNATKENYKIYGDDSDRIFIRDRIVKEYLSQYNETYRF